jgi:hypothetical protein
MPFHHVYSLFDFVDAVELATTADLQTILFPITGEELVAEIKRTEKTSNEVSSLNQFAFFHMHGLVPFLILVVNMSLGNAC